MTLKQNIKLAAVFLGLILTSTGAAYAQGWITNRDYPTQALREERQGLVGFRILIDEQGKPESCEITKSSGYADLDEATCSAMMRRAHFKPATDEAGNPIKGNFSGNFRWVIPRD